MLNGFRLSQPCFSLIFGCESHIADATIEKWESMGQLHTSKDPAALIPGEGAAGLLLADAQQVKLMPEEAYSRLHRTVLNQRNKSADSAGQISDALLTEMVQDALTISHIPAEKISLIAADTDHRNSRMGELMGMGFKSFPDLDPNTQYLKVQVCVAIQAL